MKTNLFASIIAFILLFVAPFESQGQKIKTSLTNQQNHIVSIMTYNIRHGKGMDSKVDLKRIADEIATIEADIVALQEVDYKTDRSGNIDTPTEIANLTGKGYKSFFGAAFEYDGGQFGNALLSKTMPIAMTVIPLEGKDEPRSMLIAEFVNCYVAVTHLSLDEESRLNSVYKINEVIESILKGKYVEDGQKIFSGSKKLFFLVGDFNMVPESSESFVIQKNFHWISKSDNSTFPSDNPDKILDYIFLYKNKSAETLFKDVNAGKKGFVSYVQPEKMASDHRPVILHIFNGRDIVIEDVN